MITLSLVPAILMGDKKGGWNPANKLIGACWCLAADCIYLIPWVL